MPLGQMIPTDLDVPEGTYFVNVIIISFNDRSLLDLIET